MRKPLLIALALLLACAGVVVGVGLWRRNHVAVSLASIPVSGGVHLSATVIKPKGSGEHPLVVMPTSWGSRQTQYLGVGSLLAHYGFVVVAYTQRGFNDSGGDVDFAGPATVADASTVIDWAIKNVSADPAHIGMLGQSYGAGVSLLAAERDPRIKAVVALSTWTRWGGSLVQNGTLTSRTLSSLLGGGSTPARRLDSDLTTLALEFSTQPAAAIALIDKLSPQRSPMTGVAELNRNKTAVMMANGFQDSLFNPQQLVDFYAKLTGPKRLELNTGDHGQAEEHGMVTGNPVGPVGDALHWLRRYVQGAPDGIDSKPPIELQDATTGAVQGFSSWPVPSGRDAVTLPLPRGAVNLNKTAGQWTAVIAAGQDSVAASPREDLDLLAPYRFPVANLNAVNPHTALRWEFPATTSPVALRGTGTLSLSLVANAPVTSVFAYLYDVKPSGLGSLICVTPDTVSGLSATAPTQVRVSLVPTDWTVPAGDHIALVIDTADGRWTTQARPGTGLGVSSGSRLVLPVQ